MSQSDRRLSYALMDAVGVNSRVCLRSISDFIEFVLSPYADVRQLNIYTVTDLISELRMRCRMRVSPVR